MGMRDREDTGFDSAGERCAAWLYRPDGDGPHPCVVLAHGFGGTREGRLGAYAERFAEAGIAAVVFDYRHFGDSEGEPRQLLSIPRQLADWRAAIAFARALEGIDPERIALWGTSFSGGHVVKLAAEDHRIAAVVSQAPFTDGANTLRAAGLKESLRLTAGGLLDGIAALVGGEPLRIPVVAPPGKGAAMSQPGSYDGYLALFDPPSSFRNEICGRVALELGAYAPALSASKVRCPLLVCAVGGDAVTPPGPALRMAERAPQGKSIDYGPEWGHFDIYVGELFERTIVDQTAFLARSLRVAQPVSA
jgi:fermentation-respiration switch protein FrsA (DUF1100 family)